MKRGRLTTECMFSCEGERHKNCNVKGVHYVRVVFSFCLDLVTKRNAFKDILGYGVCSNQLILLWIADYIYVIL